MTIRVKELAFSYWQGTNREAPALRNISFELQRGEWGILLGSSGCGKSTLLSILAGFLFPVRGDVRIGETKLTRRSAHHLRKRIGMVLQFPENQLFASSVLEEMEYGLKNRGIPEQERKKRIGGIFSRLGLHLNQKANLFPFNLSTGEKRMLAMACVLALRPEILLLDEPASGLDPKRRKVLFETLRFCKDEGMTILQATHDPDEVLPYADKIFLFSNESDLIEMPVSELFSVAFKKADEILSFFPPSISRLRSFKEHYAAFAPKNFRLEEIASSLKEAMGAADE